MFTDRQCTNSNVDYMSMCERLRARAAQADFRIAQTQENTRKRNIQETVIKQCQLLIRQLDQAITTYTRLLHSIQDYMDDRQKDSNIAIASAMRAAAAIVPSCDRSIVPRCEEGEAWFETPDGIDVSRLEGSGFRSILSVLMRTVVLRANPQFLQTLILDEIFAKLSVENSATLSSYLPILAQDMQVVSIEQKPEVFSNNSHTSYKFYLDGDHTVVQREDVTYD